MHPTYYRLCSSCCVPSVTTTRPRATPTASGNSSLSTQQPTRCWHSTTAMAASCGRVSMLCMRHKAPPGCCHGAPSMTSHMHHRWAALCTVEHTSCVSLLALLQRCVTFVWLQQVTQIGVILPLLGCTALSVKLLRPGRRSQLSNMPLHMLLIQVAVLSSGAGALSIVNAHSGEEVDTLPLPDSVSKVCCTHDRMHCLILHVLGYVLSARGGLYLQWHSFNSGILVVESAFRAARMEYPVCNSRTSLDSTTTSSCSVLLPIDTMLLLGGARSPVPTRRPS